MKNQLRICSTNKLLTSSFQGILSNSTEDNKTFWGVRKLSRNKSQKTNENLSSDWNIRYSKDSYM